MPEKTFTAYHLYFQSPLHIGDIRPNDYGKSEFFLRSDTLHAAVLATWAKMGRELPDDGDAGFQVSSLFPFTTSRNGDLIHFFPKLLKRFNFRGDAVEIAKKLKKVQWLDRRYFERQLADEAFDSFNGKGHTHLQGIFCSEKALPENFISTQVSQRVTIPRLREGEDDPRPFYMERLFFREGSGLFFLFQGEETQQVKLEEALDLLREEGLGTDRTVGQGAFTYQKESLSLQLPEDTPYRTNLSLLCPAGPAEWQQWLGMAEGATSPDPNVAFQLIKRGGWITSTTRHTFRKRSVYMLQEAGIFKLSADQAGASSIDLTPEDEWVKKEIGHPIWRNGSSIFVPVKM